MTDWIIWLVLAGAAVMLEMFTGTFYLLMLGVGLTAGGLAALAGASSAIQFIVAAVVGVAATVLLRRSKLGKPDKTAATRDPNVNLDIGQAIAIDEWMNVAGGHSVARAMYRGALWDVELEHGGNAQPGWFTIHEIRGSRLVVANKSQEQHTQGKEA